ncbi:hypothetical protein SK128_024204, partial [Halocaridina rubra]
VKVLISVGMWLELLVPSLVKEWLKFAYSKATFGVDGIVEDLKIYVHHPSKDRVLIWNMEMSRNAVERNLVSPESSAWGSQAETQEDKVHFGNGGFFGQFKALLIRNFTLKLRERRKTLT